MNILVLSDLHIGEKAVTKDLQPQEKGIGENDDKFVLSFIEMIEQLTNNNPIQYLVIPGDITNKSQMIEYQRAGLFIENIRKVLKLENDKILFVPGNHDIDWSVFNTTNQSERNLRKVQRYNTMVDSTLSFSTLVSRELIVEPFIKIWEFDDIIFVGFNSSWHDNAILEDHYGIIEIDQIQKLNTILTNMEKTNKLKIFLLHHHLCEYPNTPREIDISCLKNAISLIEVLSQHSFNFVIHGHRHWPFFHSLDYSNFESINYLCSGSYSHEVPTIMAGRVGNVCHIITFDNLKECRGMVLTKAYDAVMEKWIDSREYSHGIDHIDHFGCKLKFNEMFSICKNQLQLSSGSFIEIKTLETYVPELRYMQNVVKKVLFEKLQKELNIVYSQSVHGEIFYKN